MPLFRRLPALFVLLLFQVGFAQAEVNRGIYVDYQQILEQFLTEKTLPGGGLVSAFDYEAATSVADTENRVSDQRKQLAGFDPEVLEDREAALAFWINAYNFFMLDQILTQKPRGKLVSSVWDYGGRINPFSTVCLSEKTSLLAAKHSASARLRKVSC